MILSFIKCINNFNESFFSVFDDYISTLPLKEWVSDAIIDSVHILPFLFVIFFIIELIEFNFSRKLNGKLNKINKYCVAFGSLLAIFPQCGFSVITSSLYVKRVVSRGCLIAVYLATSDEMLPVLLSIPEKAYLVLPIIIVKFIVAIAVGYLIEFILPTKLTFKDVGVIENLEEGCCHHDIATSNKKELFLHPICHTFNVFIFILIVTLVLNYYISEDKLQILFNTNNIITPIFTSALGLLPNCAVSIALTMMLVKGTLSFGAVMAGLLSNAGLGLLILLKNNDFIDTLRIATILFITGAISGILLDVVLKFFCNIL